jgi:hypothetical protein
LDNDLKSAVKKGFAQITSSLLETDTFYDTSALHQFFINNIKSGDMKVSKVL